MGKCGTPVEIYDAISSASDRQPKSNRQGARPNVQAPKRHLDAEEQPSVPAPTHSAGRPSDGIHQPRHSEGQEPPGAPQQRARVGQL